MIIEIALAIVLAVVLLALLPWVLYVLFSVVSEILRACIWLVIVAVAGFAIFFGFNAIEFPFLGANTFIEPAVFAIAVSIIGFVLIAALGSRACGGIVPWLRVLRLKLTPSFGEEKKIQKIARREQLNQAVSERQRSREATREARERGILSSEFDRLSRKIDRLVKSFESTQLVDVVPAPDAECENQISIRVKDNRPRSVDDYIVIAASIHCRAQMKWEITYTVDSQKFQHQRDVERHLRRTIRKMLVKRISAVGP